MSNGALVALILKSRSLSLSTSYNCSFGYLLRRSAFHHTTSLMESGNLIWNIHWFRKYGITCATWPRMVSLQVKANYLLRLKSCFSQESLRSHIMLLRILIRSSFWSFTFSIVCWLSRGLLLTRLTGKQSIVLYYTVPCVRTPIVHFHSFFSRGSPALAFVSNRFL